MSLPSAAAESLESEGADTAEEVQYASALNLG
jgi:hypothetical protein